MMSLAAMKPRPKNQQMRGEETPVKVGAAAAGQLRSPSLKIRTF